MTDEATDSPLRGRTIAVTAERRAAEFTSLLHRRGARVRAAAALHTVPVVDDPAVRAATDDLVGAPPDLLIAGTGIGFRGWMTAADDWGVGDALRAALAGARVFARGPKAAGALRGAGLREEWSAPTESSAELVEHLADLDVVGLRVAVQLHGSVGLDPHDPQTALVQDLRDRGAEVVEIAVYRTEPPVDRAAFDALVVEIVGGGIDAVTFTAAPAAIAMLARAEALGLADALHGALTGPVAVYCVGPVTAAPLARAGIASSTPERMRLAALVRLICDDLPTRR